MERKWSVRTYRYGDMKKIKDLHYTVRPLKTSEEDWIAWWKWQHEQNPAGPPIIFLADADGILAGQYEIVRMNLRYNGRETMGFHSQDTMTHPDFRRQGIFRILADRAYKQGAEEGGVFVFGFPNQYSHPGLVNRLDFMP